MERHRRQPGDPVSARQETSQCPHNLMILGKTVCWPRWRQRITSACNRT